LWPPAGWEIVFNVITVSGSPPLRGFGEDVRMQRT
jgi:hypothetical protein